MPSFEPFLPCGTPESPPHSLKFRSETLIYDQKNQPLSIKEGDTLPCLVVYCDSRYLDIEYQGRSFAHVPRSLISSMNCPECSY